MNISLKKSGLEIELDDRITGERLIKEGLILMIEAEDKISMSIAGMDATEWALKYVETTSDAAGTRKHTAYLKSKNCGQKA